MRKLQDRTLGARGVGRTGNHLALKGCLGVLSLFTLIVQVVVLPMLAQFYAVEAPEFAYLKYPTLALSIGLLMSPQIVYLCTWRLASFVTQDRIFTTKPLWWVNLMGWSALAGCIPAAGLMYVTLITGGPPTFGLGSIAAIVTCLAVGLIVFVLRGLLARAIAMRSELDEVI